MWRYDLGSIEITHFKGTVGCIVVNVHNCVATPSIKEWFPCMPLLLIPSPESRPSLICLLWLPTCLSRISCIWNHKVHVFECINILFLSVVKCVLGRDRAWRSTQPGWSRPPSDCRWSWVVLYRGAMAPWRGATAWIMTVDLLGLLSAMHMQS